jgi:hypothetical protein
VGLASTLKQTSGASQSQASPGLVLTGIEGLFYLGSAGLEGAEAEGFRGTSLSVSIRRRELWAWARRSEACA